MPGLPIFESMQHVGWSTTPTHLLRIGLQGMISRLTHLWEHCVPALSNLDSLLHDKAGLPTHPPVQGMIYKACPPLHTGQHSPSGTSIQGQSGLVGWGQVMTEHRVRPPSHMHVVHWSMAQLVPSRCCTPPWLHSVSLAENMHKHTLSLAVGSVHTQGNGNRCSGNNTSYITRKLCHQEECSAPLQY